MADELLDFDKMPWTKVARMAKAGDAGAQSYFEAFEADMMSLFEGLASFDPLAGMLNPMDTDALHASMRDTAAVAGQKERAAIDREEMMVRELAKMRERAEAAEAREVAAEKRSERRERFMVRLTIVSVIFGAVGSVAAVVATFA